MSEDEFARSALERRAARHAVRRRRSATAGVRLGGWRWPLVAVALAALATLVAAYGSDRIPRGVRSIGVALGGLGVEQAAARLGAAWPEWTITVTPGDDSWQVPPAALGLVLDAGATARAAHARGRSPGEVARALVGRHAIDVPPVAGVDADLARANLPAVARLVEVTASASDVRITGGRAEMTPPRVGRELDADATLTLLDRNAASVVGARRFTPVTRPVPPPPGDPTAAVVEANRRLERSLPIHLFDPVQDETVVWDVPPAVWSTWVSVAVDRLDASRLVWTTDTSRVAEALDAEAGRIGPDRHLDIEEGAAAVGDVIAAGRDAVTVRVYHAARRHRVASGETIASIAEIEGVPFPWIQAANPDVGDAVWPGQDVIIPTPDLFLPLPVVPDKRIVVSIGEQRMWAYEGERVKWDWPVSTGIDSSPTSPGVFQIQSHEPDAFASNWNLSMPHFMGIYRPLPASGFMNGFHGFPTRDGSALLWTGSLGHPVTYGCVLVSSDNAEALYDWAEDGVVVEIRRTGGRHGQTPPPADSDPGAGPGA
jgi:lipoprotein-anchoring transpeptidase ErfK/SrfK